MHDYAGVNYNTLWNVLIRDIPAIIPKIRAIHDQLPRVSLDDISKFL